MLRAIIVDDEAPARSELHYLLEETGEVEVVAEASNVRQALELLKEHGADLMFLDIKMPGVSGTQLAEALNHLKKPPQVIFVTAYAEFAAKAFDLNAIDYLVKPVEVDRLKQALAKVSSENLPVQKVERIMVEKGGKKLLIPVNTIQYIMAKDDYSYMHAGQERYLSTTSLAQLEERLAPHGFFRIHRRYLVNLDSITEILPQSGGTLLLTLENQDEQVPVSRRRVASLKKKIGK